MQHLERWLWKIALVLLPLGTVFVFSFAEVNGSAWALGNITLGIGEIVLVGAVLLSTFQLQRAGQLRLHWSVLFLFVGWIATLVIGLWGAMMPGIGYLMLLRYVFVVLLVHALMVRKPLETKEFVTWWMIGSVVPLMIGITQVLMQGNIEGNTFLGIAPHLLGAPGTSVIEVGGERLMRAYATFAHPNVFGAYLVVSCMVLLRSGLRWRWDWIVLGILGFGIAATFSRAAILALLVFGICEFGVCARRISWKRLGSVLAGLALGVLLFLPAYGVRTGMQTGRLEGISISERKVSLERGWELFRSAPLVGVGVMQSVPTLAALEPGKAAWNFEPAHMVPLLALAEWGIFGSVLFWLMILLALWLLIPERKHFVTRLFPCVAAVFVLAALDHALLTSPQLVFLSASAIGFLFQAYERSVS